MNNIKIKRINNELVKVISQTITDESTDKLLHTVTITGADTSADLSFAKIYFTSLTDKEPKELEKEMNEASDFFRKFVAQELDLRQTPKLKFVYDNSIAYATNIEKKINQIHQKEEEK